MGFAVANQQVGMEYRDVWSTAYVNDLPDSAFLVITPGGTKTGGKTDGAHRFFPVYDSSGALDLPHLRNALARIPQASSLTPAQRTTAMTKAKALAAKTTVSGDKGEYAGSAGSGRSAPSEQGLQMRTFDLTLELRADGDGRTILGRAVPYGPTIEIGGGKQERFLMGAFAKQIQGGQLHTVKLHGSHNQRTSGEFPIGKTVHLAEQPDGLHGAWQAYDTPRGEEALHLVKTGEVTGLSVGFRALQSNLAHDGAYERVAAHLDHVVLTTNPAYADAQVMAVRSHHPAGHFKTHQLAAHRILELVNGPG